MSARLTVIFYIILCLEAGIVLTLLPWIHPFGLGDWGDNYFLLYAAQKTGLHGIQNAVSSGWVRGAVSGLGILNLIMAFWEIIRFRHTVRALETNGGREDIPRESSSNENRDSGTNHLSNYEG
jgi:hypothetical protein